LSDHAASFQTLDAAAIAAFEAVLGCPVGTFCDRFVAGRPKRVMGSLSSSDARLRFIDANHKHLWPTLDLLAALPCLRAGATVPLHDINNLPVTHPQFAGWGVKHLFDDLDVEKQAGENERIPNIGTI
jgi:hypothetical protein